MKRRRIFCLVCGFICLVFLVVAQAQEKYPSRAIEFVVPYAPGGSADISGRILCDDLARVLKVPVTVVNRGGGAGINGTASITKAKKDGYTLLQTGSTPFSIMPVISKEATYDPIKDFIQLAYFGSVPSVFAVKSDSPFKTLEELIEYARKNPGKLKNSASGIGESQFNLEVLCTKKNIKITTIPYKGGGEALTALLGGHGDMASLTLSTIGPQIKAGEIRGLAISSKTRHPEFLNIPTTAELGYPYVHLSVWTGACAPAGVPQSVINVLIPALEKVLKNPEVIQRGTKVGFVMEYMSAKEFEKFIESEIREVEKIAQDANLSKR